MTVFINNRTAVHQNSGGILRTTDVCKNHDDDNVSYTNIAKSSDAAETARTVFINGYPVCHQGSIFSKSTGDESGKAGVQSGTLAGKAEFITGSNDVFIEGNPAVRHGDLMVSNNRNTSPMPLMQPGAFVPPEIKAQIEQLKNSALTDYQISMDIAGQTSKKLSSIVQADNKSDHKIVALNRNGDENFSNVVTRRLNIINVQAEKYFLNLAIKNSVGEDSLIPLAEVSTQSVNEEIAAGMAKNILVPVYVTWATYPNNQSLNVKAGDLTEITRFPEVVRDLIYQALDQHSSHDIANKPWTSLLPESTQTLLQQQLQPGKEDHVQPGWLYVFKDGKLWREVEIINGKLREVDLSKNAGLQQRTATGMLCEQLILPYKINGEQPIVEVAYSTVQWRWQRINFFGGMDGQDPRLQKLKRKVLMPSASQKSQAAGNREERFIKLDLSQFVTTDVQLHHSQFGPEQTPYLKSIQDDYSPTLFIYDPINVVARALLDLVKAWNHLQALIAEAQQEEYFKSALLSHKVFFDDRNAHTDKKPTPVVTGLPSTPVMTDITIDSPNEEKQASYYLDREKIEKILRVQQRAIVRQRIRYVQTMLITLVSDNSVWSNQVLNFMDALKDYFCSSVATYIQASQVLASIVNNTSIDPQALDSDLDVNIKTLNVKSPGLNYLLTVFSNDYPLYDYLFPIEKDKITASLIMIDTNVAQNNDDGSGKFNLKLFQEYTEHSLELFNNVMALWLNSLNLSIVSATTEQLNAMASMHLWLLQASQQTAWQDIQFIGKAQLEDNSEIIGFERSTVAEYHKKQTYDRVQKDFTQAANTIPLYQVDVKTGKKIRDNPIFEFTQEDYTLNRGAFAEALSVDELYKLYRSDAVFLDENIKLFALPESSIFIITNKISNSINAVLLGFKLFNLGMALRSLTDTQTSNSIKVATLVAAIGGVVDQIAIVSKIILDKATNGEVFRGKFFMPDITTFTHERFSVKLSPITCISMLGDIAMMYLTIQEILKSYREHEQTKLVVQAIMLTGLVVDIVAKFLKKIVKSILKTPINPEDPLLIEGIDSATVILLDFLSVIGIITSVIVIISAILENFVNDAVFVHWAKNSFFSKDYQNTQSDYESAESLWNLLIQPRITILDSGVTCASDVQFYVDVDLPYFQVNSSCLDVRMVWQQQEYVTSKVSIEPTLPYLQNTVQQFLKPYRIDQVMDAKVNRIVRMTYYYNSPIKSSKSPAVFNLPQVNIYLLSKMRLYLDNMSYQIPEISFDEKTKEENNLLKVYKENLVVMNDKTWLYSKLNNLYK